MWMTLLLWGCCKLGLYHAQLPRYTWTGDIVASRCGFCRRGLLGVPKS